MGVVLTNRIDRAAEVVFELPLDELVNISNTGLLAEAEDRSVNCECATYTFWVVVRYGGNLHRLAHRFLIVIKQPGAR